MALTTSGTFTNNGLLNVTGTGGANAAQDIYRVVVSPQLRFPMQPVVIDPGRMARGSCPTPFPVRSH